MKKKALYSSVIVEAFGRDDLVVAGVNFEQNRLYVTHIV